MRGPFRLLRFGFLFFQSACQILQLASHHVFHHESHGWYKRVRRFVEEVKLLKQRCVNICQVVLKADASPGYTRACTLSNYGTYQSRSVSEAGSFSTTDPGQLRALRMRGAAPIWVNKFGAHLYQSRGFVRARRSLPLPNPSSGRLGARLYCGLYGIQWFAVWLYMCVQWLRSRDEDKQHVTSPASPGVSDGTSLRVMKRTGFVNTQTAFKCNWVKRLRVQTRVHWIALIKSKRFIWAVFCCWVLQKTHFN